MSDKGDWQEYSRLVLGELTRLSNSIDEARKDIQLVQVEIATLKVKAGVWGIAGGLIPVAIAILVERFK